MTDTQKFYDIKNNLYQTAAIFHVSYSYIYIKTINVFSFFKSLNL